MLWISSELFLRLVSILAYSEDVFVIVSPPIKNNMEEDLIFDIKIKLCIIGILHLHKDGVKRPGKYLLNCALRYDTIIR